MQISLINGLLGSGKTSLLLNLLKNESENQKVVVLVNEFGEIGIDGDLLSKKGADVVELPNGCICCTLNADLRSQIAYIAENYYPDRLYIEPTGIATIKNLLGVLGSLSLEKYIDDLTITVVLDASSFEEMLSQNRGFVETQLEMADFIMINKCDLVDNNQINSIQKIVKNTNPSAQTQLTTFGKPIEANVEIDSHEIKPLINPSKIEVKSEQNLEQKPEPEVPLKNYQQFSHESLDYYDSIKLRRLFQMIRDKQFGEVDRAKGIFKNADNHWVRIDLASGRITESTMSEEFAKNKIIIIGTDLNKEALAKEIENCLIMR